MRGVCERDRGVRGITTKRYSGEPEREVEVIYGE
jgi:hypothetical protein